MTFKMITNFKLFELNDTLENRKFLIKKIQYTLECSTEQSYSGADLEVDSDPVYYSTDDTIALINNYLPTSFEYVVYGGYKHETELESGHDEYIKLGIDDLIEIWTIIKEGVEYDMIELDFFIENEKDYEKLIFVLDVGESGRDKSIYPNTFEDYLLKQKTDEYDI